MKEYLKKGLPFGLGLATFFVIKDICKNGLEVENLIVSIVAGCVTCIIVAILYGFVTKKDKKFR